MASARITKKNKPNHQIQAQAAKKPAPKAVQAKGKKAPAAAVVSKAKGKVKTEAPKKAGGKLESLKNLLLGSGAKGTEKASKKAPASAAKATPVAAKTAAGKPAPAAAKVGKAVASTAKTSGKAAAGSAKGAAPVSATPAPATAKGKGKSGKSSVIAVTSKRTTAAFVNGRLTVSDPICREAGCESLSTTATYCRLHYIKNWKKIKRKELILKERKLNQYIEELVAKYPDKYIEAIRQDLANDKEFSKVIHDLELDESIDDFEGEGSDSAEAIIDNIKRDFDDEGETF